MAFGAGTKLGHYQVTAPVGAGGMGEVYRAHDDRLGRDVAVKVLPESLARDEDRLRRFTAEARAVAALNHPNILAIYDVGTQDGVPFIVTELLKGETLRERLRSGALPTRRALEFARQIASGLAAAHEAGIVHRDLKPENIFVTADGQVKLLDFGVAKVAPLADDLTQSKQTAAGAVVGTVGYMSPEQVRGKPVDHRSDIFSLGVVLYETLSGTRAFQGDSGVEVMNAILKDDPPELTMAGTGVAAVVEHCLQKDPGQRFQSARDLSFALAALSSPSQTQGAAAVVPERSRMPLLYGVVLAVLAVAALAWWYRAAYAPAPARKAVAFQRLTDFVGLETAPAISPDNKAVAFVADAGGSRQIWVHLTAGGNPLQLTHDAGDHLAPRWSQDAGSLVYFVPGHAGESEGAIWEIAALGGVPRRIASALTEADVSHDGQHLAFFRLDNSETELVVSDRNGTNLRIVAHFKDYSFMHPRWSPDDASIAYEHADAIWSDDIWVIPATGGTARKITDEDDLIQGLAWTPDGSAVVYSSALGSTSLYLPGMHLWVQRLGQNAPQQLTFDDASYQDPDVGHDGRVVAARWRMQFDIWKFPVAGDGAANASNGVRITEQTGQVQTPSVAPDESAIAFLSDSGGHGNIWVKDLKSGELRQVTHETDPNVVLGVPIWSPDGKTIAFAETQHVEGPISDVAYWGVRPDGSELRKIIPEGAWASWSPDGKSLYYSADIPTKAGTRFSIFKVPASGGNAQLVRTEGGSAPVLAPDGATLYYVAPLPAMRGLRDYEIRRARPEGGESTVLLQIEGERVPIWQGLQPEMSHDGKWLALTLNDEYGTDLWLLSTADNKLHRAVDFGKRRTFIARRIAWSHDDRYIYAAVGEGDADVVSLDGLIP